MKNEQITVWGTRYALTNGIQVCDGVVHHFIGGDVLLCQDAWIGGLRGKDWHRTPEAALARAEEMRKNKIESLKKSIAKLESMTFSVEG